MKQALWWNINKCGSGFWKLKKTGTGQIDNFIAQISFLLLIFENYVTTL